MQYLKVNSPAVDGVGGEYSAIGQQLKSQAASVENPSTMMMGLFMAPFMAAAVPLLTSVLRASISGSGQGYEALGGRLKNSAKCYADGEARGQQLSATITKELS